MIGVTRAYTNCCYGQMHYREAGHAHAGKAPIVLLHQNPSSSWEYEELMQALGKERHVIAFDTPGYGMSDFPEEAPNMAQYVAAFQDAIDNLSLVEPIDYYGFHTGALFALEMALHSPEQTARVAVTGIPMYPAEKRAELLRQATQTAVPDEEGTVVLDLLGRLWDYIVKQRDDRAPFELAVRSFAEKSFALERLHWAYFSVWSYDYERLRNVSNPVLVLQPDEQLREASVDAAKLIPNAKVQLMEDLDRDIFTFASERIASELLNFYR